MAERGSILKAAYDLGQFDVVKNAAAYPRGPLADGKSLYTVIGWEGGYRGTLLLSPEERTALVAAIVQQAAEIGPPASDDAGMTLTEFALAHGYDVRHDAFGFYTLTDDEADHEDAGNLSAGFDGRPHHADIEDAWREAAVRAAGWELGGDGPIWWHTSHGSWKHAASWGRTYASIGDALESSDYPAYAGPGEEGNGDE